MIVSASFQINIYQLYQGDYHDTYTIITTRTSFIRCAKKHSNYAEGTPKQEELTKQLVSVAEQNIALIDETIGFADSELATQILGAEGAANLLQHAKDIKAQGAEFCDCAACVAAKNIIDLKAEIMQLTILH